MKYLVNALQSSSDDRPKSHFSFIKIKWIQQESSLVQFRMLCRQENKMQKNFKKWSPPHKSSPVCSTRDTFKRSQSIAIYFFLKSLALIDSSYTKQAKWLDLNCEQKRRLDKSIFYVNIFLKMITLSTLLLFG